MSEEINSRASALAAASAAQADAINSLDIDAVLEHLKSKISAAPIGELEARLNSLQSQIHMANADISMLNSQVHVLSSTIDRLTAQH